MTRINTKTATKLLIEVLLIWSYGSQLLDLSDSAAQAAQGEDTPQQTALRSREM